MMDPALQPAEDHTTHVSRPTSTALAALPLYIGFAATGVGVALPGALLPVLLLRWGFHDEQGGRLFLLAFLGSSLGSLLIHGSLRNSLLFGTMAVIAGSFGLAFCPPATAFACIALYGFGLGLSMTSISLIRQRQSGGSGTVLVRLNLFWAVGALACPSFTVSALQTGDIRPVLFSLALCFFLLAVWTLFQPGLPIEPSTREGRPWAIFRSVPAGLILMTLLIPGVEASASGWLSTYAKRGGRGIAEAVAAPSCFWAGLLLSRLFWSTYSRWRSEQWTVRASALLMAAASILLIASGSGLLILIAAFFLGFGIGPVYPLLLAWALRFHRSGAIFFLAGVGASCLPWLTGFVSSQRQSLRVGLAVPMTTTILLAIMSLLLPLKLWSKETPC